MTYKGIYVVNRSVTTSTAITIIQIKAGATNPLEIIRVSVNQSDSTTSAQTGIRILRKSAAATVTSFTPLVGQAAAAAAAVGGTSATGITATAEGTDGDILIDEGFNALNGFLYLPVPEERILVPAAGIIGIKFPVAPASALWKAQVIFGELA